jgi:hypothetical protein
MKAVDLELEKKIGLPAESRAKRCLKLNVWFWINHSNRSQIIGFSFHIILTIKGLKNDLNKTQSMNKTVLITGATSELVKQQQNY